MLLLNAALNLACSHEESILGQSESVGCFRQPQLLHIDTITSTDNGQLDHYVVAGGIRVDGDNLKFDKTNVAEGLFAKPGGGAEVRLTTYLRITDTEILAVLPAALSGPLTIRAAAAVNGVTVRSFTYSTPITT